MLYFYLCVAVAIGATYVWATKRHGRAAHSITWWRNAISQNWALYRRRLLKRTRSQTPPSQIPLIISDQLAAAVHESDENIGLELRSVTSDGGTGEGGIAADGQVVASSHQGGINLGGVRRRLI